MISDLRYGVTGRTLNSGKWTRSVETDNATSSRARRACARVMGSYWRAGNDSGIRPDIAKPPQGPAPLWSQDSSRRLLPGRSRAGQGA